MVEASGAGGSGRRVISLADLLPLPPAKRRRSDHGTVGDVAACAEPPGCSAAADSPTAGWCVGVRRAWIGAESEGASALLARLENVERSVRAALPHLFGDEERAAYEERTGNYSCPGEERVREAESQLRRLLPHLFDEGYEEPGIVPTGEASSWAEVLEERLSAAQHVAECLLGVSSDEDVDEEVA